MWREIRGGFGCLVLALLVVPWSASANHDKGCVPSEADPSTYHKVDLPNGQRFYIQEQEEEFPGPLVPGTGFLSGGATNIYEETNGLSGLQNGHSGDCLHGPICLIPQWDFWGDNDCGHGPDLGVAFIQTFFP